jgi:hypothetical protein
MGRTNIECIELVIIKISSKFCPWFPYGGLIDIRQLIEALMTGIDKKKLSCQTASFKQNT